MDNQQPSKTGIIFMKEFGFAFWQSQANALEDMYFNQGMSTVKIGEVYGVKGSTIGTNMKRLGFSLRKIGSASRPNAIRHTDGSFFDEINTEQKAYVLGFIVADGCISKNGTLMFANQEEDVDVIEKIRDALQCDAPIRRKEFSCRKPQVMFSIHCIQYQEALSAMGIDNRKTYTIEMSTIIPFVPDYLERHFLRGMFDGDGGLGLYKYPYLKKHTVALTYTGRLNVCEYVRDKFGLSTKLVNEKSEFYSVRSTCREDIMRIGHYLYDDATIYMDRKINKFREICEACLPEM